MSKIIQAFLSGVFFTFILDFFLFLGIKINYINIYNIDEFYNILFTQHQNIFLFLTLSVIIGYIVIYLKVKSKLVIIGTLFAFVLLTLIEPIGMSVGKMMLMHKNVTLRTDKYIYHGDLLYSGRKKVYFYSKKFNKMLIFEKNKIVGAIEDE